MKTTNTNQIPTWIMGLNLLILGILAFKTYSCVAHPEWIFGASPDESLTGHGYTKALAELAGRNLAMIAVSVAALWRRSRSWYRAVFILALVRESVDMLLTVGFGGVASIGPASAFLLFIVSYTLALRQLTPECTDALVAHE